VKDFIRENGKVIAITAAAAMLLSLIIGLFTRNPFGVVFFRAVLLAVFFAFFASAVVFTLKKFMPEIGNAEGPAEPGDSDAAAAHVVDIVLPEEPMAAPDGGEGEPGSGAADSERYDEPDVLEEAEPVDLAQEEPGAENAETGVPAGEQPERAEAAGEEGKRAARDETGSLDNLPDFGFIGEPAKNGAGPRSAARSRVRKPEDAARGLISEEDPESLAKAIRTVINRDEKG
jgi:hypothetical protein